MRSVLLDLLKNRGKLNTAAARRRYGNLREPTQILTAVKEATENPAQTFSPLERLLLQGLIFYDKQNAQILLPYQIALQLQSFRAKASSSRRSLPLLGGGSLDALVHDLGLLLALLQAQPTRPLHRQWLPPRFLELWGSYAARRPERPRVRSELQTDRRRFIHYLAENAGFVAADGDYFTVTPRAWLWLKASPGEQRRLLWDAWLTPHPARRQKFRLPGMDWLADPASLLKTMLEIAALPLASPDDSSPQAALRALATTLFQHNHHLLELVPPTFADREALLLQTISEVLAGPWRWLGVLVPNPNLPPPETETAPEDDFPWGWSDWGAHWLGIARSEPLIPPPGRFELALTEDAVPLNQTLMLRLSEGLPTPADLMTLMAITTGRQGEGEIIETLNSKPACPRKGETRNRYHITAASYTRALHRGWSAAVLAEALQGMIERPLTGQERSLLQSWAKAAERVTIQPRFVLEASDPAVIVRLAATRRGRAHIVRTLSPRAVAVNGFRLEPLVRRLTAQEGTPPRVQGSAASLTGAGEQGGIISPVPPPLRPSAHIWLALRVYHALGEFIDLPARLPQGLLDNLAAQLDEVNLAAAEGVVEQTLDRLKAALVGRAAFSSWPEEGLPVEESLSLIEKAIASGEAVELVYYALSTDMVVRRVVEPYRVEWWGGGDNIRDDQSKIGTPYLVGFCRRAQGERVFRLDRIREIRGVG